MESLADTNAAPRGRRLFSQLQGWRQDDLASALDAFRYMTADPLHAEAVLASDPRAFFTAHFRPGQTLPGHFTAYYEPELDGARQRSADFPVALHREPPGGCTRPRAEIDAHLSDHALVWLRDDVDRYFAQVQGSARIRFADGDVMRVGFAAKNQHPYVSIGRHLVRKGILSDDITAETLKTWLRDDPRRGKEVMNLNPSYVFFRELKTDPTLGPITTLGCPATTMRTIAIDPNQIALGTPIWVETDGIAGLWIAQDTGSAIKGEGRADLFFGTGDTAGHAAGKINHEGLMTPLLRK